MKPPFTVTLDRNRKAIVNGKKLKYCTSSCRTVFFMARYVIKFDIYYDKDSVCYNQCAKEYEFWLSVKDTKWAKYFVPVLQFGYTPDGIPFLVMPRVKGFPDHPCIPDWANQKLYEIQKNTAVCDLHSGNLICREKSHRIRIFDYGISNNRNRKEST